MADLVDLAERRMQRRSAESEIWKPLTPGAESEFRVDLERLRFAPSFARLADVTQVVSAGAIDGVIHNRLTHSIKVTAIARAISVALDQIADSEMVDQLGGLDHAVPQSAAVAHDLGHPPFGHLGERTLDRLGRERFGLSDGFEGNAQTFRVITELEMHGIGFDGLNLTAAVRAAVLKYPWGRSHQPKPHPSTWREQPRGAGHGYDAPGSAKFGAYLPDLAEMSEVIDTLGMPPGRQTLECSVMDLADDIAYSLHDLEDFHRSGVLQFSPISSEFRTWLADPVRLSLLPDQELERMGRTPATGLELLRRRLADKDGWVYDHDAFTEAVRVVGDEFVDGILTLPYDGSLSADRVLSGFLGHWIDHFISSVRLMATYQGEDKPPLLPTVRAPLLTVTPLAWHQIQVLKFVHQYFVLHRPDLAMLQRGQAGILHQLVRTFDEWLADRTDAVRAPKRLLDLVRTAEAGYHRIRDAQPELLDGRTSATEVARMARGRGIIDFVAGLSDTQALAHARRLGPSDGLLWSSGLL